MMAVVEKKSNKKANKKSSEKKVVIKSVNLKKTYKLPAEEVYALKGVTLDINEGEFVALMGPSGSGKSTFFNLIGCLDSVTEGSLNVGDYKVSDMEENELQIVRKENIGFVFQDCFLIPTLTAVENVELPYVFSPEKGSRKRAIELLEKVGLGDRLYHLPKELSGGQMQRVAIARALACKPKILLADEPTRSLDTKSAKAIYELFRKLCEEEQVTVIVATHNVRMAYYADRIIRLKDGLLDGEEKKEDYKPREITGMKQSDCAESKFDEKVIDADGIKKSYVRGSETVEALRGVDFSISPGEVVALVGPSGSGKTTLMNLISCLDSASDGTIRINNEQVNNLREGQLIKIRRENIGFVFQYSHILPTITLRENIEMPLLFSGKKIVGERIMELIEMVGLKGKEDRMEGHLLSGGEKQRVAIARAMVNDPKVILADEPTGRLDLKLRDEIMGIFKKLSKEKKIAIFIATHDLEVAAMSDRVIHLQDGKVVSRSSSTLY